MANYTLSSTITLPEFIRAQQVLHPNASSDLTNVLLSIALATKVVARGVNMAGLASMLGMTGETNVQGEAVQKLDVFADQVFGAMLGKSGEVISMVSEEREQLFAAQNTTRESKYVVAFDPLDGSSNIDVNVAIGTIWGVYRRESRRAKVDPAHPRDFLQPGERQVAAGYTIYGSSTMFVFSTGDGVNGFILDPEIGEFVLTHPKMRIPESGATYSCNEGNYHSWSNGVKRFVDGCKQNGASRPKPLSLRYVGSLVADFHRTMLKGGIFLYPADKRNPGGKLRLLYECAPLAFIVEQAGGRASDGTSRILGITPKDIHDRSPFIIGSPRLVEECEREIAEHP
jgi:fructose-1,6-bisphosphatase I